MQVGDIVVRRAKMDNVKNGTPLTGRIVYIHPEGRFHVVEFAFDRPKRRFVSTGIFADSGNETRSFRESFSGTEENRRLCT